jgi:hypothetical protein
MMKKILPILIAAGFLFGFEKSPNEIPSLYVQHETKGNQVRVECIVTGISFREDVDSGEKVGKMAVWIDGKRISEFATAVFIIKNLAPGSHKIKLELVNPNNELYGLSNEFIVNIPK